MSYTVFAYQDSVKMWQDMSSRWQAGTEIVFASPVARERFVSEQKIVFSKSATTLADFWQRCAHSLGTLPEAVIDEEVLPLIRAAAFKTKNPELEKLAAHRSGFKPLLNHLIQIERVADLDYAPVSDLEKSINQIRQELIDIGKTTLAAQQSQIARMSQDIVLENREIIFAPLPDYTMQIGGLIKGLSRNNQVSVFQLSKNFRDDMFDFTGLDISRAVVDSSPGRSVYFKNDLSMTRKDQVKKGLAQISTWQKEGKKAAIVVPDLKAWLQDIVIWANSFSIDLFYRDFQESGGFSLSRFLIYLEQNFDNYYKPGLKEDIEFFLPEVVDQINLDNIEIDLKKEGIDRLRLLIEIGKYLDIDFKARSWLERLGRIADDLENANLGLVGQSIETILLDTGLPLRIRGRPESSLLVNYQDIAQVDIDAAVFIGFDQSGFNLNPAKTFVSPALARKMPKLIESTANMIIDQAILAPREALLLRGEALSLPIEREIVSKTFLSDDLKIGQKPKIASDTLIRLERDLVLEPDLKDSYSVSELEAYLRCPRGWFVKYRLNAKIPSSKQAKLGELRHFVLEKIGSESVIDLIDQFKEKNNIQLSSGEYANLCQGLLLTSEFFHSPDWPFEVTEKEVFIEESYPIDFEKSIKIKGKADRVDWSENKFLLTDFKSSVPIEAKKLLQIDLYPELIRLRSLGNILSEMNLDYLLSEEPESQSDADSLDAARSSLPVCIGSIYFSVPNQKISGYLENQDMRDLFLQKPSPHFKPANPHFLREKIKSILEGMANPDTYLGLSCSSRYCAHNFLGDYR